MDRQNQSFKSNVAGYLADHSIIVPSSFTDVGSRKLKNGKVYNFDLQTMKAKHVNVQTGVTLVLLTVMELRGVGTSLFTHNINAMWLEGPTPATSSANLPPHGINYIFTESLGGCSVYIDGGKIHHNPNGTVPPGVAADQQLVHPYPGTKKGFDQTCAVAYFTNGSWKIDCSIPHDVFGKHRTHKGSGYEYLGY